MTCRYLFLLGLAAVGLCGATARADAPDLSRMDVVERSVPQGPVALVDGESIGRQDFLALYETQMLGVVAGREGKPISDSDRIKTGIMVLYELVQREILRQEAQRRGITVSDAQVQEAYKREMDALARRMNMEGKDAQAEQELLRRSGKTREQALSELREALMIEEVFDQIGKKAGASVSDAEVKKYYDEHKELFRRPEGVHLRQIYIRPKPSPQKATPDQWKTAEDTANKALGRVKAGESFEAVAKAMSSASDAERGGDMGMGPADQLPPFYQDAASRMKPGEISGVIKSDFGYHVIKLEALQTGREAPFEEAQRSIRRALLKERVDKAVSDFCEPILNEPGRVQVFLQLEKNLATALKEEAKGAGSS